jgi:hypothetical protein
MLAGDAETALAIYERLLVEHPNDTGLRLEAARAHYAAGNTERAIQLGHQVLMEFERQRLQVRGAVQFGVLYDTNANQGGESDYVRLGNWDVFIPDSRRRSSAGGTVRANVDAGYRMSALSPWWLVGDANVSFLGYSDRTLRNLNRSRWMWGRAAMGFRYLYGNDMFDARFKGEIFDHESGFDVTTFGADIRYIRVITPSFHLIGDAGLERRSHGQNRDRDGNFTRAGGFARFIFGEARHDFLIGGGYRGMSANIARHSYDGWHTTARFNFRLPHGFTVSPQLSYSHERYNGPATALETRNRRDGRWRIGTDLSYMIDDSWSIHASYHYTSRYSTSNLFGYDQHSFGLGMIWRF